MIEEYSMVMEAHARQEHVAGFQQSVGAEGTFGNTKLISIEVRKWNVEKKLIHALPAIRTRVSQC